MSSEQLSVERDNNRYYGYCMTPDCNKKYELPHKNWSRIDCNSCGISWCIKCGDPYHIGKTCNQYQQEIYDMEMANNLQEEEDILYEMEYLEDKTNYNICVSCKNKHRIEDTFEWTTCKHLYCIECAYNIIVESLCEENVPKCIKCKYNQPLLSLSDAKDFLPANELNTFQEIMILNNLLNIHKEKAEEKQIEQQIDNISEDDIHVDDIDEITSLFSGWFRLKVTAMYIPNDIKSTCRAYYGMNYFVKSNIINDVLRGHLIDLLSQKNIFKNYKPSKRVYCGSLDGFDSRSLYEKMHKYDNDGPTIFIIQTDNGSIFGVYMTVPWKLNGNGADRNAFIFSLRTELILSPHIFDINQEGAAVSHPTNYSQHLIFFGLPASIHLANDCNNNHLNYCDSSQIENDVILCSAAQNEKSCIYGFHTFKVNNLEIHQFTK